MKARHARRRSHPETGEPVPLTELLSHPTRPGPVRVPPTRPDPTRTRIARVAATTATLLIAVAIGLSAAKIVARIAISL